MSQPSYATPGRSGKPPKLAKVGSLCDVRRREKAAVSMVPHPGTRSRAS